MSTIKARCEVEVERIEKQFDECIAFLLRVPFFPYHVSLLPQLNRWWIKLLRCFDLQVLSFKLNVGHFPHLADLVTRINYNFFYMSGSGNLKTTTAAAETATSRLAKPFPSWAGWLRLCLSHNLILDGNWISMRITKEVQVQSYPEDIPTYRVNS